jgi:hypothetical protein
VGSSNLPSTHRVIFSYGTHTASWTWWPYVCVCSFPSFFWPKVFFSLFQIYLTIYFCLARGDRSPVINTLQLMAYKFLAHTGVVDLFFSLPF